MFVSSDWVRCVAFDPQKSNILASCSDDKTIKIWDIESGSCLSTLSVKSTGLSAAFSPDGFQLVAGCLNGWIYVWRQAEDEKKWELQSECPLRVHSSFVNSVPFAPDGKFIASGSSDKTIKIWDAKSGALESTFRGHSKDNPECTCKHDAGLCMNQHEANPECPVTGHRYVPFPCIECLLL